MTRRLEKYRPPGDFDYVPIKPFLEAATEAVESGRLSWAEIARSMGRFSRPDNPYVTPQGDVTYIKRVLGLKPWGKKNGLKTRMRYVTAVSLVRALGLDPVDFDI